MVCTYHSRAGRWLLLINVFQVDRAAYFQAITDLLIIHLWLYAITFLLLPLLRKMLYFSSNMVIWSNASKICDAITGSVALCEYTSCEILSGNSLSRCYRYTASRDYTYWTQGRLGRFHRNAIPIYVVRAVRRAFPSASFPCFQPTQKSVTCGNEQTLPSTLFSVH